MIDLLFTNKLNIITSICLAILSFYLLKKFIFRQIHPMKSRPVMHGDNTDEDDSPFRCNVDKRSLRPSYARFMRRKVQQELNNESCLCIICWNDRKTVVLLPCKHLCVCISCSKKLSSNVSKTTCPICRNEVDSLLEVYV